MARTPRIPPHLRQKPFTLEEARLAGLTKTMLRGKSWRRIGTALYAWTGLSDDPWLFLSAWQCVLPSEAVFAGPTAAWLHGIDLDPTHPVEVIVPARSGVRSRPGLHVRRCDLVEDEIDTVRNLRVTIVPRTTLCDLCLRRPAVEALIAIDAAIRCELTDCSSLVGFTERHAGVKRLRALAAIAAPAESPMETRLRWLLLQAGLPMPEVQSDLHDARGRFIGRADMYYASARLVIEFDGANHRDRLVDDNRRQNLLMNAGFRILRFTSADVHRRPDAVQAQVSGALHSTTKAPWESNSPIDSTPLDTKWWNSS